MVQGKKHGKAARINKDGTSYEYDIENLVHDYDDSYLYDLANKMISNDSLSKNEVFQTRLK